MARASAELSGCRQTVGMRVLMISGSLSPMKCGVGDYTAHLALALCSSATVGVMTDSRAAPQPSGIPYDVWPIVKRWSWSEASTIVRAVRRWNPDIVHFQFPTLGYGKRLLPWTLPAVISLMGFPIVQTWHEYYPAGSGWRNILNALTPGGLIVVRPEYKERMPAWYRALIRRKHFRLIPNAAALPTVALASGDREELRQRLGATDKRLVAYFGFVYPAKGVETLFDVADPARHHLVIIADLNPEDPYHQQVLARVQSDVWRNNVVVTGFLSQFDAAAILAAADAVVLPFSQGGGFWNTSVHAAAKQGTFVLTTSRERSGYDPAENVFYAAPGDTGVMRDALVRYAATRRPAPEDRRDVEWSRIACAHCEVYEAVMHRGGMS
jgi:glycosyltransferase involved in cell wall biosynthesis